MSSIPYHDLRPQAPTSFHIRPLRPFISPDDAREIPHRHNFQEIMWVRAGNGRHTIDDTQLEVTPNTFYLIAKGQVHQFLEGYNLEGYLVRFTDDFLLESLVQKTWTYRISLFNNVSVDHTLPLGLGNVAEFEALFSLMMAEHQRDEMYGKMELLRNLLLVLLLKLERLRQARVAASAADEDPNRDTFHAFLQLLEERYTQTHNVGDYASQLNVTPRQLTRILQTVLGKTTKQVIEERLILEAKRYLTHTNASVKEISYLLGYKDPSYFSKVFKRATDVVPQTYRRT